MKMNLSKPILIAAIGLFTAWPAWSHHSTAMFDYSKTETVAGTVKDFQWANPHSYLQVLVPDGKGGNVEWSIEVGTPTHMARLGWTRESFKPGDKVTVALSPMKDGSHAGTVKTVTLQDGKVLAGQGGILSGGGEGRGSSPPLFPTLERATPKKP
jgi:Family of unknown function (DUF6152)